MADRDLALDAARPRVLVLGGGPAGCAAALTLRRHIPGLSVSLVARAPGAALAVGETLSPGVLPLLDYLGLRAAFLAQPHLPCGGTASSWGGALVMERSYLFSGRGQGWHLDRAAFDGWLWQRAAHAGAQAWRARATGAARVDGAWQVEFDDGAQLRADVVIDASGRQSWLARHGDAAPRRDDALVADARWFEHDGGDVGADADADARVGDGALVESVADGWWYSASLPGGRGVAMFMTDGDLRGERPWAARLEAAPATQARLAAWRPDGRALVRAAHSQCARTLVGDGWLACGDAAAAFDPISSLGIGFALRSGMEAARVAVGLLEGDGEDQGRAAYAYAASIERIYADYRARLAGIYALERRWPREAFWRRRHGG